MQSHSKRPQAEGQPREHILRAPPRHIEAERAVLGAVMLFNDTLSEVLDDLEPESFYLPKHTLVFESMISLQDAKKPVDIISVADDLRVRGKLEDAGGIAYLSELADQIPSIANVAHYVRIVREKHEARKMLDIMLKSIDDIYTENYGKDNDFDVFAQELESDILGIRGSRKDGKRLRPLHEENTSFFERLESAWNSKKTVQGIPTGLRDLDKATGGLMGSLLVVLAGRPSMGKTATALQLMLSATLGDPAIAIPMFSAEMSTELIHNRVMTTLSGVSGNRVRGRSPLKESDPARLTQAALDLKDLGLYVDDTGKPTISHIRSRLNRLQGDLNKEGKGRKIGMIVVDYLQIMGDNLKEGAPLRLEIAYRTSELKALAKQWKVPVICLSQLNRELERRPSKRPIMSDLAESSAIENDADLIMFCYRDEVYHEDTEDRGVMELIIAKQRDGEVGTVRTRFDKEHGRISDLVPEDSYNEKSSFADQYS